MGSGESDGESFEDLPVIPIEIIYIIFDNIRDMKELAMVGMTCKGFYKRFQDRFNDLLPTVDLKRLKYDSLKQFVQKLNFFNIRKVKFYTDTLYRRKISRTHSKAFMRECVVNDVYNGFLNKYMPKRMEGVVAMDFYDFWGFQCTDKGQLKEAMELLDQARELETDKFVLRNSMDLVWFIGTDRDPKVLIEERIYDFLGYLQEFNNS